MNAFVIKISKETNQTDRGSKFMFSLLKSIRKRTRLSFGAPDIQTDTFLIKETDASEIRSSRCENAYFAYGNYKRNGVAWTSELKASKYCLIKLLKKRTRLRFCAADVQINSFLIQINKETDTSELQNSRRPNWYFL